MTEHDLIEVNGLVARHGYLYKTRGDVEAMREIERRLLELGLQIRRPLGTVQWARP